MTGPPEGFEKLLTGAEVARIFRVDPATVARWDRTGRLKAAVRTPGRHRRYAEADVRALLNGKGGKP